MNYIITKPDGHKLFLGDCYSATDKDLLAKNDISAVLSVYNDKKLNIEGIETKLIYVEDVVDQDLTQYFEEAFDFINSNKNVLVHCHVGWSRSAAIVIGYVMKTFDKNYEQAFNIVNSKRPIGPNEGFVEQLGGPRRYPLKND